MTDSGTAPTVITYNAMMQALAAAGRVQEGFELLLRFETAGLAHDEELQPPSHPVASVPHQRNSRSDRTCARSNVATGPQRGGACCTCIMGRHSPSLQQPTSVGSRSERHGFVVGAVRKHPWSRVVNSSRYKPVFEAL
eukprot:5570684-Prymnesium_polylepis.3